MKNVFKKAVSLTIALSTVAALSVSAFATPAATYDPTDDSVTVTGYETVGAGQYAVAVVPEGFTGAGENADASIYYVNQAADTGEVNINTILADMLLKGELAPGNYEVRIGTNATIEEGEQAYTCIDLVVEESTSDGIVITLKYGDVNADGTLTAGDGIDVIKRSVGLIPSFAAKYNDSDIVIPDTLADVNADGGLSAGDGIDIIKKSVGLILNFINTSNQTPLPETYTFTYTP